MSTTVETVHRWTQTKCAVAVPLLCFGVANCNSHIYGNTTKHIETSIVREKLNEISTENSVAVSLTSIYLADGLRVYSDKT